MMGPAGANCSTSALSDGQNLTSLRFRFLDSITSTQFAEACVAFREEEGAQHALRLEIARVPVRLLHPLCDFSEFTFPRLGSTLWTMEKTAPAHAGHEPRAQVDKALTRFLAAVHLAQSALGGLDVLVHTGAG